MQKVWLSGTRSGWGEWEDVSQEVYSFSFTKLINSGDLINNVTIFNSTLLCIVGPWYPQIQHQLIQSADAEQYNMKSQLYYTILCKRLKHPRILVSMLLLLLSCFSRVQLCAIQRDLETSSLRILRDIWTWILQENRVQGFLSQKKKKREREKGKWKESKNCRRWWIC